MRAAWGLLVLAACSSEQLQWATPEMSEPFERDVQAKDGFSNDIYVTGNPVNAGDPDDRMWCRVSLAGTPALGSDGQPADPPLVLDSEDAPNLEYWAVPEVDQSSDGYWYYSGETWPGQEQQGVLLDDVADPDGNLVIWFACEAVLPLSPVP